jgi:myo-inositol-1(or 4)-monophosphatase
VDDLEVAARAARAGGQVARAHLGNPLSYSWKGHRELVAGASLRVQDAIFAAIREQRPHDALLGEEGDADEPLPLAAERLWIVDPIDGSLNFFQGLPLFCVSVGLRDHGSYRVGVVYDPCRDELFQAGLGSGARVNGRPIYVEQTGEGPDAYERSLIGTDWPGSIERRAQAFALASVLATEVVSLTALGSPALGLCYVAAGRLHAYCHVDLKLWDVAAAAVIVQEAGGVLTDLRGGAWQYSDGGILASNGVIHGSVLRSARAALRFS